MGKPHDKFIWLTQDWAPVASQQQKVPSSVGHREVENGAGAAGGKAGKYVWPWIEVGDPTGRKIAENTVIYIEPG